MFNCYRYHNPEKNRKITGYAIYIADDVCLCSIVLVFSLNYLKKCIHLLQYSIQIPLSSLLVIKLPAGAYHNAQ